MRLIDADALSAELRERGRRAGSSELTRFVFDGFAEIVDEAPTVEQTMRQIPTVDGEVIPW